MSNSNILMFTLIMVMVMFLAGRVTEAQTAPVSAPSPALSSDCFNTLLNMSDCLTFVEKGSKLSKPEAPCCGELAGLVESSPICLCHLLGDSGSFGLDIDINKAMKLPSVCKIDTPPPSTCALLGIPVGGPTSSEGPTSSTGSAPSSGNDVQPPGPSSGKNGVSGMTKSSLAIFVGLAIAFIPSFF